MAVSIIKARPLFYRVIYVQAYLILENGCQICVRKWPLPLCYKTDINLTDVKFKSACPKTQNSPENYEGIPPPFIPVATGIVPNLKRNTH